MDGILQFSTAGNEGAAAEAGVSISELFGKETLEDIMRKLSAATGLAFVTIDYRGDPVTELVNYSSFCQKIQDTPERRRVCEASSALGAVQAAALQKTYIYFCPCGLLEVAIPIVVRGQYLGGFIGGQIRCEDAPADTVQLKTVLPHSRDFTLEEDFREEYDRMHKLSYEQFVSVTELASLIINQLGEKAMANLMQQKYHSEQMALQREKERRIAMEKDLNESQLIALRSQMSSYFLMSTLTAISNLAAVENAPQTNEVITMFARFLANTLHGYNNIEFIDNELNMTEQYLSIQKVRMGEKLEYEVSAPEDIRLQRIPGMILFPFVECAIYYGIACKQGNGRVAVSARYDADDVVIRITDDGPGFTRQELESLFSQNKERYPNVSLDTGVGIARQRLRKYFGREHDVVIEAVRGRGTTYTIRYPRSFDEGNV